MNFIHEYNVTTRKIHSGTNAKLNKRCNTVYNKNHTGSDCIKFTDDTSVHTMHN